MDKLKKKDKTITITLNKFFYLKVGIIILLCIGVLGTTYAWFKNNMVSDKVNRIIAGSISLSIDDEADSGIEIVNALPEADSTGMKKDPYMFTITNTGSTVMVYSVNLVDKNLTEKSERLSDNSIKINFKKDGADNNPVFLNSYTTSATVDGVTRILDNGFLKPGETHNYSFQAWIDFDAGNEVSNKEFAAYIKIGGTQYVKKEFSDYFQLDQGVLKSKSNYMQYFYIENMGYVPQELNIPSEINGSKVTSISDKLFYANYYITKLTIPYTVTSIGNFAFFDCYNVETVTFENTDNHRSQLETIGDSAFSGAYYDRRGANGGFLYGKLVIPASVKTIGSIAFAYSRITTLEFEDTAAHPSQLETVGRAAFSGTGNTDYDKLVNVYFPNKLVTYGGAQFIDHYNLISINFNGTKSEWNTLNIQTNIVSRSKIATIHCVDGDINL